MKRARGMTLVELMIVVAIIGVMGSVGLFAISGSSNSQNTAALARSLQFGLARARAEAISDNHQRELVCTSTGCTYLTATTTGSGTPTWQTGGNQGVIQAGKHAVIWNVSSSTDYNKTTVGSTAMTGTGTIIFYPDGTATASTIYVADTATTTGHKYKIYVYPGTGLSRLVSNW